MTTEFTKERKELIFKSLVPTMGALDFHKFIGICERSGLDPEARQIYAIERGGKWSVTASIDGFRLVAQRTGQYGGQLGPYWCGRDGVWVDVWTKTEAPFAAKVGVMRSGFAEPIWSVARFEAYAQKSPLWGKMPDLMIAKVAEMLGLRRAFPQELSGLYGVEEMEQAGVARPEPAKASTSPTGAPKGLRELVQETKEAAKMAMVEKPASTTEVSARVQAEREVVAELSQQLADAVGAAMVEFESKAEVVTPQDHPRKWMYDALNAVSNIQELKIWYAANKEIIDSVGKEERGVIGHLYGRKKRDVTPSARPTKETQDGI